MGGLSAGSREANRTAAAILEVLAGVRTPTDAASALSIAPPRYYQLEQRALEGLLSACEPRRLGRVQTPDSRIATLEKEVQRWRQECARQQALVRAAQRTIGLAPPRPKVIDKSTGKRKRRPTVRALKAARTLQSASAEMPEAAAYSGMESAGGVQPALVGARQCEVETIHAKETCRRTEP
jgi:hypothetical protein